MGVETAAAFLCPLPPSLSFARIVPPKGDTRSEATKYPSPHPTLPPHDVRGEVKKTNKGKGNKNNKTQGESETPPPTLPSPLTM